ncbi:hypothetical protein H2204_010582 [Knufia peltigerae]|uniref:Uncharacterized protein n=1 Tax=Knufia peltigerae TaxID=1002370 RepID=A0AA38XWU2_9EURO|nr:hypothetical protein H2204_010582 [Knufia peltigerae]
MATKSYNHFTVSIPQEWIAHVEINRPEKLNAFTEEMWLTLPKVFDALSDDPRVRVIILSGAGDKAFSAGLDLQSAAVPGSVFNPRPEDVADGARFATKFRRFAYKFQDCVSSIERCEKPVICVLHGISLGIAVDISVCADLRICTSNTSFSVKEVDIGVASDVSTLSRLPKVVGSYSWVKEVCLTARTFGAEEALRVGLVNSIFENKAGAMQEASRIAAVIASKSPVAVQATKNFLDWNRDHDIATGLKYTAVFNAAAINTKDVPVAMAAARTKVTPKFEKL